MPAVFYNAERHAACACHGDDFIAEGLDEDHDALEIVLRANFETKAMGRIGEGGSASGTYLKRVVRWDPERKAFTWCADPRL
eukprot:5555202-Lingulodinium_polyedra.AAC.1